MVSTIIRKDDFDPHGSQMVWDHLVNQAEESGMITREQAKRDDLLELTVQVIQID